VHQRVTLVVHDWGSALGFDWANRHREASEGHRVYGSDRGAAGPGPLG
jgi:pimeloyl-ACP methyl ester carboxylesterase